jgi:hypothetical protein
LTLRVTFFDVREVVWCQYFILFHDWVIFHHFILYSA